MADQRITKLMRDMMDIEVTPILPDVPGIDLGEYKNTLIERFANPAIRDTLARLGTDGSDRIPKFILPSVSDQLRAGGPNRLLSFVVASWFR
jgi:mannitol 2-dehydrogenase